LELDTRESPRKKSAQHQGCPRAVFAAACLQISGRSDLKNAEKCCYLKWTNDAESKTTRLRPRDTNAHCSCGCRIKAAGINLAGLIGDSVRTLTECLPTVRNKSDGKFQVVPYLLKSFVNE